MTNFPLDQRCARGISQKSPLSSKNLTKFPLSIEAGPPPVTAKKLSKNFFNGF